VTVLIALGSAGALRATLQLPDLVMLFLLAVMVVAAWFGRGRPCSPPPSA